MNFDSLNEENMETFGKNKSAIGRIIPTRWVGEQHVREDLGFIPSFADWAKAIRPKHWMGRATGLFPDEVPVRDGQPQPDLRRDQI